MANGRDVWVTHGMVKFLADAKTDEILSVHIVGPMASELISEAVVVANSALLLKISRVFAMHPSLSETTKEAALQ